MEQAFRMPLNTDDMIFFDGFDDSIFTDTTQHESCRACTECLMMIGIDWMTFSHQCTDPCTICKDYIVACLVFAKWGIHLILCMLKVEFIRDVLNELCAFTYSDDLNATADSQDRFSGFLKSFV